MNEHKKINELLVDFILGELSQKQASEVQTHLAGCPQCSGEIKRLKTLLDYTDRIKKSSADERTCQSAKEAILQTVESQEIKQPSKLKTGSENIWRIIMKNPITKIAAAAVIIIATILILQNSSINGSAAAYAKVIETVKNVPCMKISYNSEIIDEEGNVTSEYDTEIWYSFDPKVLIQKHSFGLIEYEDYSKNEIHKYTTTSNKIVVSALSGDMPSGTSPWEWLEKRIERTILPYGGHVTRKTEQYDGEEVELFEIIAGERPDIATVHDKIYVDKATSLPIAEERIYINSAIGKPQRIENGTFEYPDNCPSNIYELGLSKDIPIINSLPFPPWQDMKSTYDTHRQQMKGQSYIAIVTSELALRSSPVEIVELCYSDGIRLRHERHLIFGKGGSVSAQWREQEKDFGDTLESILKWSQDYKAYGDMSISIFGKGKHIYGSRRKDDDTWETTISTPKREITADDVWNLNPVVDVGWPEIRGGDIIQDDYARENNLIRIEYEDKVFYLNPERDYICQRRISADGHISEVTEFAQTEQGQWYPVRVEGRTKNKTVYLEMNPDFPAGIFDPNNLPKQED